MNSSSASETSKPHSLGIAGLTARAFITSPLSLLLLVSFFVIGVLGLMITPRQEDPQISVPMVDVFVQYPGASVKEVEGLVARPLESILSEMTGVEHVYSISGYGQAMITVQFEVGEDLEASLVKLYDKLSSNRDRMPLGAHEPLVKPKGVDDVPVVTITLWSNEVDDAQLRLIGMDVTQKLREVNNTSQSFMVSGRRESVQVEILPERLATFGVTLDQVARVIQAANSEREVGRVESSSRVYQIYSGAFLNSADEIKRLMVAVIEGRPVYVQDIADVKQGPGDATSMVGYYTGAAYSDTETKADNAAAVTIAIAKKHRTNGVNVSQAVLKRLETLKGQIIPDNVNVAITRDYGDTARVKVNDLIKKLFIATGIVTILVCLALGVRAGTVVLLVIPSVITTTVFAAWALGMTIDRVSLFALIFSIGILVDDAIVVVENIYRRWLLAGNQDLEIAVDAVREVGNPTILATATVIAALLPMGFVSGMMGPYMAPIPVLGSIAMIISLFAAFAFTPWLTNVLKPSLAKLHQDAQKEHKLAQRMERFFRALLIPLVERKALGYLVLLSIIGVFFAVITLMYPLKSVPVKMLPLDNKPEFNVVVNLPEGTALPVTANLVHELATKMQPIAEITALQTYVGTASPFNFNGLVRHYYLRQQPWQADIQVQLVDKTQRKKTSHQIALEVRDLLTPMVLAAKGNIEVVEMPPGPPVLQTVVAEVYGPDDEVRRQVAKDLTGFFGQAESLTDVRNLMEADYNVIRFEVDENKVQRAGITVQDINRTLEMALGNFVIGDIKNVRSIVEPTVIILQIPLNVRSQMMRLAQLPVRNTQGKLIPLHELGSFKQIIQDKPIFHKDLRPVEFVTAEGTGRLAAPVYGQKQVEQIIREANYVAPDGTALADEFYWLRDPANVDSKTAVVWGGEWTVTFETFRDMGIAFGAALILIYMLIVAQFGNFTLPAIIMAPIPLTLIGIIPGHWIMNAEFTATSMIGFIALAGIIVRNSILLVDFAREAVSKGSSVIDAVIHSCEARTRPILITALALLGGSSVIITDPIFQGMAVSLIFGGAVSTLLTLIVIPLGCISAGRSLGGNNPQPTNHGGNTPNNPNKPQGKSTQALKSTFSYAGLYLWSLVQSMLLGLLGLLGALWRLIRPKKQRKAVPKQAVKATESKPKVETPAKPVEPAPVPVVVTQVVEPVPVPDTPVVPEPQATVSEAEVSTETKAQTAEPVSAASTDLIPALEEKPALEVAKKVDTDTEALASESTPQLVEIAESELPKPVSEKVLDTSALVAPDQELSSETTPLVAKVVAEVNEPPVPVETTELAVAPHREAVLKDNPVQAVEDAVVEPVAVEAASGERETTNQVLDNAVTVDPIKAESVVDSVAPALNTESPTETILVLAAPQPETHEDDSNPIANTVAIESKVDEKALTTAENTTQILVPLTNMEEVSLAQDLTSITEPETPKADPKKAKRSRASGAQQPSEPTGEAVVAKKKPRQRSTKKSKDTI